MNKTDKFQGPNWRHECRFVYLIKNVEFKMNRKITKLKKVNGKADKDAAGAKQII